MDGMPPISQIILKQIYLFRF